VVLVLGFSNLLGDGVSMAFGEYISADAEQKFVSMERDREAWELQNDPEGEVKEMVDLYVKKGFDRADAETVINTMSKYEHVNVPCFLSHNRMCHLV
jgi:VIT1/CCC1 family predicted Fe2+/Mn2+ transporter